MPLRRIGLVISVVAVTLMATNASAERPAEGTRAYPSYAKVLHAKPIVRKQYERVPVRRCTTVRPATRRYGHEPFEHCRTRHESRVVEEIKGYRITYRYAGETFERVMPHDPGERIFINVKVAPLRP